MSKLISRRTEVNIALELAAGDVDRAPVPNWDSAL